MGDALCHTDPSQAYGLSLALTHAQALAGAATDHSAPEDVVAAYADAVRPEARERYELVCDLDEARGRAWRGEPVEPGRRDGTYPLFAFAAAFATAPHDDLVLRRTVRRIGLLDPSAAFDGDDELHERIERLFARLMERPPPRPGPPREELLDLLARV